MIILGKNKDDLEIRAKNYSGCKEGYDLIKEMLMGASDVKISDANKVVKGSGIKLLSGVYLIYTYDDDRVALYDDGMNEIEEVNDNSKLLDFVNNIYVMRSESNSKNGR